MLEGLMQHDHPLTLQLVLERMRGMNGDAEVVTFTGDGATRATYAEVGDRVDRLCRGLQELGVERGRPGGDVRLELPAPPRGLPRGAVHGGRAAHPEHPPVPRAARLHGQPRAGQGDPRGRLARGRARAARRPVRDGRALRRDGRRRPLEAAGRDRYEELLERQEPGFDYPAIDDQAAAGLCYTSGTTGNPKGVLYSHRSNILHTMGQCMADGMGICRADRILPVVPMFHANAWGLPYAACMAGASLIMPNRFLQAEPLARLIEAERVTVAGAVPTIWLDVLRWSDEHKPDLSSIRMVACGGAAVPRALMKAFEERHGMRIIQAWGMTETSPLGVGRAPAGGRRGRGALGLPLDRGPADAARAGAARVRRRHGGRVGRRVDRRAAGARAVDRARPTTRTRTRPRSSTTAGCAPATSPRSTSAASSASPTAPRTSSSPAASGSPPSSSRTS